MSIHDDVDEGFRVNAPSGAQLTVLSDIEVDYFEERSQRYMADNQFVNISDLQDVDRMLLMELMVWRWATWLTQGEDYWGNEIQEEELRKNIREYSIELRQVKKMLGIDKAARDRERGESVSDYLEKLRHRARQFGIMREKQLDKALVLFNELSSLITLHDNCDGTERREMHCTSEDIMEWIRSTAIPEYQQIDAHFREHEQKMWIRAQ